MNDEVQASLNSCSNSVAANQDSRVNDTKVIKDNPGRLAGRDQTTQQGKRVLQTRFITSGKIK